jgi:nitrite reductase/ring-hydroxylating ferredoxin subunit
MREGNVPSMRDACAACLKADVDSTRREFVRNSVAAVAALIGAGAIAPAHLAGLPVHFGESRTGGTALTYPLPSSDGVTVDRDNELILVRWQERLYAFALSCPHQRSMLKWRDQERRFQCTKHKSKYTPEGTFISGRATRGMDRYPLRVEGGTVHVDTTRRIEQDTDSAAWNAASADLA